MAKVIPITVRKHRRSRSKPLPSLTIQPGEMEKIDAQLRHAQEQLEPTRHYPGRDKKYPNG